ncbi:MAG: pectate lyase [Pirellulales bacterium]|nr:pectate lyase [Pirellulales bacterium]
MNRALAIAFVLSFGGTPLAAQRSPSEADVRDALKLATKFMVDHVADHGGYAWVSSADGRYSHGEGVAGPNRVWVQPPGTPAIGLAFLQAYQASGDDIHLQAAQAAGQALIDGQLRSGGWGYSIEFDPQQRRAIPYRVGPLGGRDKIAKTPKPGGWDVWRKRRFKTNQTLIDDDTTPAAIRFLIKLDLALDQQDAQVHEAVTYALRSVLGAQYPVGAWGHNYDRFAMETPSKSHYPVLSASYPASWTRVSDNQFNGCYMLNDRITQNMIHTMLLAWSAYHDDRYRDSALRGGEFLIRAQMPSPQPAWAQQYDRNMQPVWDRKFEPPAITGGESQDVLETLLVLYQHTQDKRFLAPIPPALRYLQSSLRDDGKLARYYELKSNRPLYFTKDYKLTYDDRDTPDHYGFVMDSRLAAIERRYQRIKRGNLQDEPDDLQELTLQVRRALSQQRRDGAWLEPGFVRNQQGKKVIPPEGVVQSQTFIDRVDVLCRYLSP